MVYFLQKIWGLFLLIILPWAILVEAVEGQAFNIEASGTPVEENVETTTSTCLAIDTFVLSGAPGLGFNKILDEYSINCNDAFADNCNCCINMEQLSVGSMQSPRTIGGQNQGLSTRIIACNLNNIEDIPQETKFIPVFCQC